MLGEPFKVGATPQEFAYNANERCRDHPRHRSGELEWVVDHTGQVVLRTRREWLEWYQADQRERAEQQRQKFNWRLQHPIDEPPLETKP